MNLPNSKTSILNLYISDGHNFIGHHGRPPGNHQTIEKEEIQCLAGRGLLGDRFLDHPRNDKSHITFFEYEVYEELCQKLQRWDLPPSVFRRNVLIRGVSLNHWIGKEFEIQGIRFEGVEECKPCYWMDKAFGKGTEDQMKGKGGLRARILTDGLLRRTPHNLMKSPPLPSDPDSKTSSPT